MVFATRILAVGTTLPYVTMTFDEGILLLLARTASERLHIDAGTQQPTLAILERQRSIARVNVVQDALVADVLLGNKADARAHKGHPRGSFVGHGTLPREATALRDTPAVRISGGERNCKRG